MDWRLTGTGARNSAAHSGKDSVPSKLLPPCTAIDEPAKWLLFTPEPRTQGSSSPPILYSVAHDLANEVNSHLIDGHCQPPHGLACDVQSLYVAALFWFDALARVVAG
jgi:hypothetical protein